VTTFARLVVRIFALLVPSHLRARWREEWLAEIAAAPVTIATLRRALGAPRDAWSTRGASESRSLSGIGMDLRDALRSLRKTPIQTATVIASLAIGSTLTVAMFSIINAIVAGELPGVSDRGRLVTMHVAHTAGERRHSVPMQLSEFRGLGAASPGMTNLAAELTTILPVDAGGGLSARGVLVTGTYFSVLGTSPRLGRLIAESDDVPGATPVVVIGHGLWLSHFGGTGDAIGRTIRIGTGQYQVIGVAPADFAGLDAGRLAEPGSNRPPIFLPLSSRTSSTDTSVNVVGRLAPGASIAYAEAQAQRLVPAANALLTRSQIASIRLEPLHLTELTGSGDVTKFTTSFMLVPLIVLAIACANVAGVQLARAITRTHELAVRVSIGANRWRVARLLVVETLLMAASASVVSWFSATEVLRLLRDRLPFTPVADARVLLFSIALPLVVTVIAGLYPAWRATGFDVLSGLRLGARVGRTASPVLRRRVLVVQTMLAVFLLVLSIVLSRGVERLPSIIGPSFDNVIVSEVRLTGIGMSPAQMVEARRTIVEQLRAEPGVSRVGQSEWPIFYGSQASCWADPTRTTESGFGIRSTKVVTADYFTTLHVTPVQGRLLAAAEPDGVVVNEAFLAAHPEQAIALGSDIRVRRGEQPSTVARIVGVVPDSYERYPKGLAEAMCYLPMSDAASVEWFSLYTETARPAAVLTALQRIVSGIDARLTVGKSGSINERIWAEYAGLDLVSRALGIVAGLALLLSMVGLFGAVSHGTSQRLHEFGVRLALGATPTGLAAGIVRESVVVAGMGVALGLAMSTPLAMFFHMRLLRTITIADPFVIGVVVASVVAVAVGAALLPARRASAVNPVSALRGE